MPKALLFLHKKAEHQDCPFFTVFLTIKNLILKYLDNALTNFALTPRTPRGLLEEKAPVNDFGRTVPSAEIYSFK